MNLSLNILQHEVPGANEPEKLPHGAGLIMISKAYYSFFVNKHVCDDRFVVQHEVPGANEPDMNKV